MEEGTIRLEVVSNGLVCNYKGCYKIPSLMVYIIDDTEYITFTWCCDKHEEWAKEETKRKWMSRKTI